MYKNKSERNAARLKSLSLTKEKRKKQICRVYTVKIQSNKLNSIQKEQLKMLFVNAKWLYNDIISFTSSGNNIFDYKINKSVSVKDKNGNYEIRELNYIGSHIRQALFRRTISTIRTFNTCKKKGINVGKPKFKSSINSIELRKFGATYQIKGDHFVKIQNISGKLRVNGLNQIPEKCEIANAILLNKLDGYYLAITTYSENKKSLNNKCIGIDMGCKTSFTFSNGEEIDVKIKEPENYNRLQSKRSKQIKGSNNYKRTTYRLYKIRKHIFNIKNDISNKIVSKLNKSYGFIFIQNEDLRGWSSNGHGKSIKMSCLGRVKYKLSKQPNVYIVNRWKPTTQQCINCGRKQQMPLKQRIFECDCGLCMPRDLHSANRMIQEGIKLVPTEHREFIDSSWKNFVLQYIKSNSLNGQSS
jgi:putative transposase